MHHVEDRHIEPFDEYQKIGYVIERGVIEYLSRLSREGTIIGHSPVMSCRVCGDLYWPQFTPAWQVQHYGAPLAPGPMYLVEEVLEGLRPGRCMARPGPTLAVGQAGCEFLVADPLVAPRHCELTFNPQGATLRDLATQTGTFVRIPPGSERVLVPGDQVRLGNEVLRVENV